MAKRNPEKRICKNCGAEIPDGTPYCPVCGDAFVSGAEEYDLLPPPGAWLRRVLLIAAGAALLIGLVFFLPRLTYRPARQKSTAQSVKTQTAETALPSEPVQTDGGESVTELPENPVEAAKVQAVREENARYEAETEQIQKDYETALAALRIRYAPVIAQLRQETAEREEAWKEARNAESYDAAALKREYDQKAEEYVAARNDLALRERSEAQKRDAALSKAQTEHLDRLSKIG